VRQMVNQLFVYLHAALWFGVKIMQTYTICVFNGSAVKLPL